MTVAEIDEELEEYIDWSLRDAAESVMFKRHILAECDAELQKVENAEAAYEIKERIDCLNECKRQYITGLNESELWLEVTRHSGEISRLIERIALLQCMKEDGYEKMDERERGRLLFEKKLSLKEKIRIY